MRSPKVGKQRSASGAFGSLSRSLPSLRLTHSVPRPKPVVGKPNSPSGVKSPRNG